MGSGAPLVMLAGAGGKGSVFLGLARRWKQVFRCMMPDPEPPFQSEAAALHMLSRLDAEGIDTFHLLGVSLGGCVAQQMAAQAPRRVHSLTLSATFAQLDAPAREVIQPLKQDCLTLSDDALMRRWLQLLYGEAAPPPAPGVLDRIAFASQLDAALAHDSTQLLPHIHCPVHITYGEEDRLIPPHLSLALADSIPQATVQAYPGGHMHWLALAPRPI